MAKWLGMFGAEHVLDEVDVIIVRERGRRMGREIDVEVGESLERVYERNGLGVVERADIWMFVSLSRWERSERTDEQAEWYARACVADDVRKAAAREKRGGSDG